jgi:hypothetical protein
MKKVLLYFIMLMSIVLATTVAYVSISGLLTVFSGAGFIGLIFFSAIEISKIVATSAIHTYGKKIGWVYNSLLSLGIIIAMGITSMGVYGFLSSGYEKNSAKSDNVNRKIQLIDNQVKLKEKSRESVNTQLLQVQNSITQLRTALGNNTQSRVDRKGNVITTSSVGNRKSFESQLKIATESEQRLSKDLSSIDSTINVLSEEKLTIESKEATTNELGPLKYLSEITGSSMDNVMKWFILLLIFIGDPMAILMIIIFNKIINEESNEGITDGVNEEPIEESNEVVTDGVNEEPIEESNEELIEEVDEEPIVELIENDEPTKEEDLKSIERVIRVEDLPERSNRGFSVNIPDRKQSNLVERIGSNKEIREDNPSKVFFKKRL